MEEPHNLGSHPSPTDWRLMRISLLYLLDIFELSRLPDTDFLEALVHNLISTTSVAPLTGDVDLQARYATAEAPPPDGLRRPLPIHAIAQSLQLPYETIRRRVNALAARGELLVTREGVVQPAEAVQRPHVLGQIEARYLRTRELYGDLCAIGFHAPGLNKPAADFDTPPVRLVNRLLSEFTMRASDNIGRLTGAPTLTILLLAVARANGEHLDPLLISSEAPISATERRPVRVTELAVRLHLPEESVRRYMRKLVAQGLVTQVERGVVISDLIGAGEARRRSANQEVGLRRLMGRLDDNGILGWWDAERTRAAAATQPKTNYA